MAGRLYRMAKVVSANPSSWGVVDAKEISGFRRVAKLTDLYSIAECILSSSYGDGVTDGADAIGQIWYVAEANADYKLVNWGNRKSASGWSKLTYGGDVSIPVKDVKVNNTSVVSGGVANINLSSYATTSTTDTLTKNINDLQTEIGNVAASVGSIEGKIGAKNGTTNNPGIATLIDGKVPLEQLANIDTTFCEVVQTLPSSLDKIKKHIYLVTATTTGDKQSYAEYIYTGGTSANDVYDASKWEKLGDVEPSVDLKNYYTKTEVDDKVSSASNQAIASITNSFDNVGISDDTNYGTYKLPRLKTVLTKKNNTAVTSQVLNMPMVSDDIAGLMAPSQKKTLTTVNNATIKAGAALPTQDKVTVALSRVKADSNSYDNIAIPINAATISVAGVMSSADKDKLEGIDEGANLYVHPAYTAAAEGLYKVTVDSLGHVSKTTAVTKADITALGIPASAPTVDTAMSSTSTNAVQNKVITDAIDNHTITISNFNTDIAPLDEHIIPIYSMSANSLGFSVSSSAPQLIVAYNTDTDDMRITCSNGATVNTVLYDTDVVALTDTEINNILK